MNYYGITCQGYFIIEKLTSLPTFNSSNDEGRIIYNESDGKLYYGDDSGWKELTLSGDLGTASIYDDDRYLHRSNNLSDVDNASNARDNIDVYSTGMVDTEINNLDDRVTTLDDENVKLTGTQYITGRKYFNDDLPMSNHDPTHNYELARKYYVDNQIDSSKINRYRVWTKDVYYTYGSQSGALNYTPSSVESYAKSVLSGTNFQPGDMIYVSYQTRDRRGYGNYTAYQYEWERVVYEVISGTNWRRLQA